MHLVDWIEAHPQTLGIVFPILAFIFPQPRAVVVRIWKWWRSERKKQEEFRATVLDKLGYIEGEMKFNGGNSLRDIVWQLRNHQRASLWREARPSFEIGDNAKIDAVSETACHLFAVADTGILFDRNWFNCVDGGLDDFLTAYKEAIEFGSSTLVFPLMLKTYDGSPLGRWEMRLNMITQPAAKNPKFSGYFRPVDATAKAAMDTLH